MANVLPFSEVESLPPAELAQPQTDGVPLEFGHVLDDQIGGQIESGFVLSGFYEDRYPEEANDLLGRYMATFIAIVEVFEPKFTELQRQILRLLAVPPRAYQRLR